LEVIFLMQEKETAHARRAPGAENASRFVFAHKRRFAGRLHWDRFEARVQLPGSDYQMVVSATHHPFIKGIQREDNRLSFGKAPVAAIGDDRFTGAWKPSNALTHDLADDLLVHETADSAISLDGPPAEAGKTGTEKRLYAPDSGKAAKFISMAKDLLPYFRLEPDASDEARSNWAAMIQAFKDRYGVPATP
jgi:hypothetical protein